MKRRIILGVTGSRSEYDILYSVFREIESHPALELQLVVVGAHLSEAYGKTISEIRSDGFSIADQIVSLLSSNADAARVKGLGIQLQGLVQSVLRVAPDFLLVLGDREEAITTALVGAYMNLPLAHIGGGDRAVGNVDDQVRHAVTKLAHLHFVTNRESHERLLKLGEQPFRVIDTGNPGLDRLILVPSLSSKQLSKRLGFELADEEPLILLIQHVLSSEVDQAYSQMKITLEAIRELGLPTVVNYPNSDAGSFQIIEAIHEYEHLPFLHITKNISRLEFVNIMRRAQCMVGNSSAGILEAPLLKLPVVNVGNRQRGRLYAENVQFVSHDQRAIAAAVEKAVFDQKYRAKVDRCANPYGDGQASQRIVEVLASIPIDGKLLVKDITY